ncbi:MAG TPA: hypothetical protein VK211_13210 [Kamptonema sp.]|nr:hypothetical protein [Kamptonema sp.]
MSYTKSQLSQEWNLPIEDILDAMADIEIDPNLDQLSEEQVDKIFAQLASATPSQPQINLPPTPPTSKTESKPSVGSLTNKSDENIESSANTIADDLKAASAQNSTLDEVLREQAAVVGAIKGEQLVTVYADSCLRTLQQGKQNFTEWLIAANHKEIVADSESFDPSKYATSLGVPLPNEIYSSAATVNINSSKELLDKYKSSAEKVRKSTLLESELVS